MVEPNRINVKVKLWSHIVIFRIARQTRKEQNLYGQLEYMAVFSMIENDRKMMIIETKNGNNDI